MNDALATATGALDGLFGLVTKGRQAYNEFDAQRDQRAVVPAQTSVAPTNTAVTPSGTVALSPQVIAIGVGALLLVGLVAALRK